VFGIGLVLLARVDGICGGEVGRTLVLLLLPAAAAALVLPRFLPAGGGGVPFGRSELRSAAMVVGVRWMGRPFQAH
jgi:hypothetical protein